MFGHVLGASDGHAELTAPRDGRAARPRKANGEAIGLLDAYRVTAGFPTDHCHVKSGGNGASAAPVKFYADDMHLQPFVSRELNVLLHAAIGCG